MWSAEEPGTKNDICSPIKQWPYKVRIVYWIVLKVCILNQNNISPYFCKTIPEGGTFPHVVWLVQDSNPFVLESKSFNNLFGNINRSIVYDDEFKFKTTCVSAKHPLNSIFNKLFFVVD